MSAPGKPVVRPVWSGYLVREGDAIVDASSSVTIVEASGQLIVVDTGAPNNRDRLIGSLKDIGVRPDAVNFVVNTHLHLDHCGCNELFETARLVAHELESPPVGSMRIRERTEIVAGVELVPTPGHSAGSLSVFVEADVRVAVCGDAIPTRNNFEKRVPPFINVDPKLALRSMEVIGSWADVVIPGHDAPFNVVAKE
jgi:glyoxylase-like metal-dependent hydrolase (beta-lactamase superfamily II)